MTDEVKKYYTVAELAKGFYVESSTVRQWVHRGLIKPLPDKIKVGPGRHTSVFSVDEVKRFSQGRYGNERQQG